jgi:ABC-type uncharacterized transport system ATPase subunit
VRIYKRVQERRSTDKKARSLLILDDVTSNLSATQNGGILSEIAFESRHYGMSVVLLTQKWTNIPAGADCATRQASGVAHDLDRFSSAQTFIKMLHNTTCKNTHDFLVVVRLTKPVGEMYLDSQFNRLGPRAAA